MLHAMPNTEELKQVVFAKNPNFAPGPDCIGGKFYQLAGMLLKRIY